MDDVKFGREVREEPIRSEVEPLAQALGDWFHEMRGDSGRTGETVARTEPTDAASAAGSPTEPGPGADTQALPYSWLTEPEYANPETRSLRGFGEAAGESLEFAGEAVGAGAREAIASVGGASGRLTEAVGRFPGDVLEATGLISDLVGMGGGDSLREAGAAVDGLITPYTENSADFQRSFAMGLGMGAEATITGTTNTIAHPVQTVQGLADFASGAISDPPGTVQQFLRENREEIGSHFEEGGLGQALGFGLTQIVGGRRLLSALTGAAAN